MSHLSVIDKNVVKTHEWLKTISQYAHWKDDTLSLRALRVVLHQLRDNMPLENAVYLSAQLPIFIRGLFFENWHPLSTPLKERQKEDFIDSVEEHLIQAGGLPEPIDSSVAILAVFKTLCEKISEGEIQKIESLFPKGLRSLWNEAKAL